MLELTDCPDAYVRDNGWGSVRVLVWGSLNSNPQCWVRLYGSGKMLVVDQSDLRVAHNPGDPRDGIDIPQDWIAGRAVGKPTQLVPMDPTDHAVPLDAKVFAVECFPNPEE